MLLFLADLTEPQDKLSFLKAMAFWDADKTLTVVKDFVNEAILKDFRNFNDSNSLVTLVGSGRLIL